MVAWAVHMFTASGVILALLALDAVERRNWREALLWLFVALVIDGIDGSLARAAKVADRLPRIDGAALDLVVDYLNYVLVPALLIWRAGLLPRDIALPLCAIILVSALYVFARRDMKTDDGYFRGFPALWNVVAAYFVLTPPPPWLAAAIVAALALLTFAPIHVVHPFRARDGKLVAPVAAVAWAISTTLLALGITDETGTQLLLAASLLCLLIMASIGALRTIRSFRSRRN